MKKYKLHNVVKGHCDMFLSKQDAVKHMMSFIDDYNNGLDSDDEGYLTPFDFTLEEIESKEINEVIATFEEARKYLKGNPNDDFTVAANILSANDVNKLVKEVNLKHIKALIAYNRLCTIAQAWNKADGFEPDFSNTSQYKYFPWFEYSRGAAGLVLEDIGCAASLVRANFGSRLCFKTKERAMQFGKQFIDLWNDVFLFR